MPYEPDIPAGCHLGYSHGPDGGVVGLLFEDGTNRLVGHASWHWVGGSDSSSGPARSLTPEEQEAVDAIAALLVVALIAAMPLVKRWWDRTAAPKARAVLQRALGRLRTLRRGKTAHHEGGRSALVDSSSEAIMEVSRSPIVMSSTEWASRYEAMIAAQLFSEEQRRLLSVARLVDAESSSEQLLTAQQFAERIRLKLQSNPAAVETGISVKMLESITAPSATRITPGRLEA